MGSCMLVKTLKTPARWLTGTAKPLFVWTKQAFVALCHSQEDRDDEVMYEESRDGAQLSEATPQAAENICTYTASRKSKDINNFIRSKSSHIIW